MKYIWLPLALAVTVLLSGCGPCSNRCVVGWTYQYTPQGHGAGQWVMTPTYAQ